MLMYPATSDDFELVGALAMLPGPTGCRLSRFPRALQSRLPGAAMRTMADCAAGIRLRTATTATRIELVLMASPIRVEGVAGPWTSRIEALIDGELAGERDIVTGEAVYDPVTGELRVRPGTPVTVVFDGLPAGDKLVELWFPHTAIVDLVMVAADAPLKRAADDRPRWIHHGSSISHCLEATRPTLAWPVVAGRALELDLLDLAYAGNAMLDPFVARIIRDQPADLISLKLGINLVNADAMTQRVFQPAVHGFLDIVREGHPLTPLLVISPIYCPSAEDVPGPTIITTDRPVARSGAVQPYRPDALTLRWIRDALESIVRTRAESDPHLAYLGGLDLFGAEDAERGLLPDGLHPDEAGYRLMGERFAALLPKLVQSNVGGFPARS